MMLGFVVANSLMMVGEALDGKFFFPELGQLLQGLTDRATIQRLEATAPLGDLLFVLAGWALGTVVGAWIAGSVAGREAGNHAIIFGILIALAGIANNLMIPPPAWFWVAGVAVPVAAGFLVANLLENSGRTTHA